MQVRPTVGSYAQKYTLKKEAEPSDVSTMVSDKTQFSGAQLGPSGQFGPHRPDLKYSRQFLDNMQYLRVSP